MGKHADSVLNGWAIDLGIAKRRGFKRGKHAPTYAGKRETLLEAILASVKRTTVGKYPNGLHA